MKMTVKDLRAALEGVPDSAMVTWQANENGEYNDPENTEDGATVDEEPSYTFALGYVYSAFDRHGEGQEFVIDGAVTERE